MTTIQKVLNHVLIAAALTGVAASAAEPFIRAGASYTYAKFDPLTRQTGWEAGPVISTGYTFGSTNQQEISLESGWAKWTGTSAVGGSKFESTQIPVLLDYRYSFALSKDYRLFVGPSAGFIHQKYEKTNTAFPALLGGTDNSWEPAYGGTVGLIAKLGKNWDAQLAYELLLVSGDDIRTGTSGSLTSNPDYTRSSFQLTFGCAF